MDDFFKNPTFNKVIFRERIYTSKELKSSIDELVLYLQKNKCSDSPFIYLFAQNHIKTVIAYFSIINAGYIAVLIDPKIGPIEYKEMLQDTPPAAIINYSATSFDLDYTREISFYNSPPPVSHCDLNDVCTIVYTNAEDEYAKGAMLTKKNMVSNAKAGQVSDEIGEKHIFCALLPFHHLFGLQTGILTPVFSGSTFIIEEADDLRRIKSILMDIAKFKVTNVYSVPVVYYLITKMPNAKDSFKYVEKFCSGGYKLSESIYHRFKEKTGHDLPEGYGLTEASPVSSWHYKNDKTRIGSVGRAYPCCKIKIVDGNNKELPVNGIGEICVKGDNVFKGYYQQDKETKLVLKDNWLFTGDLGKIDKDGFLYITGLKKDMITVGGLNVYPKEVIRLIKKNSNVEQVNIEGTNAGPQGQKVVATVKLINNSPEKQKKLKDWCFKNLSIYKSPGHFKFI